MFLAVGATDVYAEPLTQAIERDVLHTAHERRERRILPLVKPHKSHNIITDGVTAFWSNDEEACFISRERFALVSRGGEV